MKNKLIFSVYNGSPNDYKNHLKILTQLKSLNPVEVMGQYKGQREMSIVVDALHFNSIKKIARKFKQESILLIDADSNGTLLYLNDNRLQVVGSLRKISKQESLNSDSWSRMNNRYFTFN